MGPEHHVFVVLIAYRETQPMIDSVYFYVVYLFRMQFWITPFIGITIVILYEVAQSTVAWTMDFVAIIELKAPFLMIP